MLLFFYWDMGVSFLLMMLMMPVMLFKGFIFVLLCRLISCGRSIGVCGSRIRRVAFGFVGFNFY